MPLMSVKEQNLMQAIYPRITTSWNMVKLLA